MKVILLLTCAWFASAGENPAGYVVRFSGSWQDDLGNTIRVASLLGPEGGVRFVGGSGNRTITIRLLECLVTREFTCSAGPCPQTFRMKDITCVRGPESSLNPLIEAVRRFFGDGRGEQIAQAVTMSRAGEDDANQTVLPELNEAVLVLDKGTMDPGPLISSIPAGKFWLEFCRSGPTLGADCEGASRVPLNASDSGGLEAVPFEGTPGLYRIRLWKLSPRGPQPTGRSALALIGPAVSYGDARQRFGPIAAAAAPMGRDDPMVRVMLGAWLLENEKK